MTLEESKKHLEDKGYCSFNLEDLNPNAFKTLKRYLMCNETNNFKSAFQNLRADLKYGKNSEDSNIPRDYKSFEDAANMKNKLVLENIDANGNISCSQIWFFASANQIAHATNFDRAFSSFLENFLYTTYSEIVRYFFDIPESESLSHHMEFTYYDKDCFLDNHSDGTGTGRICACLIYLNEDYSFEDGGYLVLQNTEKVLPKIGNVAIIDLQTFDIKHMVTKVTGGIGRYACLSFVKRKSDKNV